MSRALILRMSSMGDLIHTLPAITDLAQRLPDLAIDWLAEEAFVDIPRLHPGVQQVIPIAWRRWRKTLYAPQTWREIRACRAALNATPYDLVLDAQGLVKSALAARWVKDAPRGGYDRASIREPLAALCYDKTYTVSRDDTAIRRNRLLFGQAFGYTPDLAQVDFGVRAADRPEWTASTPYAVLLTASSRDSKRWPLAHWQALGTSLAAQGLTVWLPWGNATEKARAQQLVDTLPAARLAPRLSLAEAAALLAHADLVVGVDTGLTHLANALAVPLVALFTDSRPDLTGVVPSSRACNLGGVGLCPSVAEVLAACTACVAGTAA